MVKKKKKKKKVVVEEKPKRGGNHPKHPKCPKCNKALYKTLEKGRASRKEDPWRYCRNESCELYALDQSEKNYQSENAGLENSDDCSEQEDWEAALNQVRYDDIFLEEVE